MHYLSLISAHNGLLLEDRNGVRIASLAFQLFTPRLATFLSQQATACMVVQQVQLKVVVECPIQRTR